MNLALKDEKTNMGKSNLGTEKLKEKKPQMQGLSWRRLGERIRDALSKGERVIN